MPTPEAREKAVIDEVIKITTWKNIRRYIILGGIGFVILDLIITLTVVILIAIDTRASDKQHATLACSNTATLARIQRTTVQEQAKQTKQLVAAGETFGLTPSEFHKLIVKSKAQQQRYLASLDALAKANCTDLTPPKVTQEP